MKMKKNDDSIFWISYSDLSSGLMICFLLIFVTFVLASKKKESLLASQDRKEKQIVLETSAEIKKIVNKMNKQLLDYCPGVNAVKSNLKSLSIRFEFLKLKGVGWFDQNQYNLKEAGKTCLTKIMPIWFNALLGNNKIRNMISELSIEGHADPEGGFLFNMDLSQKRSLEVLKYSFSVYSKNVTDLESFNRFEELKNKLTAKGRSDSKPIRCPANTDSYCGKNGDKIDYDKSRRVELRVYLKRINSYEAL